MYSDLCFWKWNTTTYGLASDNRYGRRVRYHLCLLLLVRLAGCSEFQIRKYRADYHHTDTYLYLLSLAPSLSIHNKLLKTNIIIHLILSLLRRLFLVRLVDYTVNLSDFYSYSLIGKLTAFLQLQEFSQRNQTWGHRTSTFSARLSLVCWNRSVATSSPRRQLSVWTWT